MTETQSPKPRLIKEFVDQRRALYKARKEGFIEGYLEVKESLPRLAAALEAQGFLKARLTLSSLSFKKILAKTLRKDSKNC